MKVNKKNLAREWIKDRSITFKQVADRATIGKETVGKYFRGEDISEKASLKIERALRALECPEEYLPPEPTPVVPGTIREFSVPARLSVREKLRVINQGIAALGHYAERRLAFVGSAASGAMVTYRYLELEAGTDGH